MGKNKEQAKTKEPLVPQLDRSAAQGIKHPLPEDPDLGDTVSMFLMSFTAIGMMRADPIFSWAAWFILLSMYINRPRTQQKFAQSLVSLIMITFSIGFLYYRLMNGYTGPPAKK